MTTTTTTEPAPQPRASSARRSRRPERPLQKVRRDVVGVLARWAIGGVGSLPYAVAGALGAFFGGLGYFLNRRESGRALTHLAMAFPRKSRRWHRRTARRMYRHIGRTAAEFVCAVRWPLKQRLHRVCHNADEFLTTIRADAKEGRGAVSLTAHFGGWEMLGSLVATNPQVTVVARRLNDPRLDALAQEMRAKAHIKVVYQDESPRQLLRALKNHELVGILADQDVRRLPGIFVPFFGIDAYTMTAPLEIARAAGATLRCYVFARVPGGYRVIFSDRIQVPDKSEGAEGLRRATIAWTEFLEAQIRERPWQWMWMHRRWRTRPGAVARRR